MALADNKIETHGDFAAAASLTAKFKDEVAAAWPAGLSSTTREALDQIFSRIARIVVGDELHAKHWRDIQGFCQARLDAGPAKALEIESDIQRLVRTLPVVRAERSNGPS